VRPDYVIHLAAYVGGLFKNMKYKVEMYEKNILINYNVLKCSHDYNVKKVVSCLSTCIFPDKTTYPINETMLHDGPPHNSNDAYAYAKRMLEIHSRAYQEQFNDDFICVIPTNIYGEHDNFSLEDGHVIPSLIHKCHNAKQNKEKFIVRGSGKPLRQFIYSYDLARLLMWSLLEYKNRETIILSVGEKEEVSIKYVATEIAKQFNYEYMMDFDESYSDGQFKKTADNNKLLELNKYSFIRIEEGIKRTVEWFIKNFNECRK
jgi:GDP-L-fucose synthase